MPHHTHHPEGIPSAWLAGFLHRKMYLSRMGSSGIPGPIRVSFLLEHLKSSGHPIVPRYPGKLKIIHGPQDVILPSAWVNELQKVLVNQQPGLVREEQLMLQDEFHGSFSGKDNPVFLVFVSSILKFGQAFEYGYCGVQGTVFGAASYSPAIKTTVGHTLIQDTVHNGNQLIFIRLEVGSVVQNHRIDANIAPFRRGRPQSNAAIVCPMVLQYPFNGLLHERMVRWQIQIAQVQQCIMRANPFRLIKSIAPMSIGFAPSQEFHSPAFRGDSVLQFLFVHAQQIASNLILNGNIPFQKPFDDFPRIHGCILFG